MYFRKVTLSVPASPASTLVPLPLLLPLPPLRQQNQFIFFLLLSPLNVKMMKMNTFMMIYFHLKSSKYSSCYTVNKLMLYMHVSSCENLLIRIMRSFSFIIIIA